MTEPRRVPLAGCPVCGKTEIVEMMDDWQAQVDAGAAIPIVGCGNPWHYLNLREHEARADLAARIVSAVEGVFDAHGHPLGKDPELDAPFRAAVLDAIREVSDDRA